MLAISSYTTFIDNECTTAGLGRYLNLLQILLLKNSLN